MEELEFGRTPRRGFLGRLAAGTLALAASGIARADGESPARSKANPPWDDTWMTRIKGKHRQVFDAMEINSGFPLVMTDIWLMTNHDAYGIPEKELSAVIVLRHNAIAIAMNDAVWAKYKLGEAFNVTDAVTSKPAERNVFATAKDFAIPPFPTSSMEKLRDRGVIFCGCNMAMIHFSSMFGEKVGVAKEQALQDWVAGLLPGVTRVPSGVLAVGRAQEHSCNYCNVT
jgi:intracellular sulfur oxidation DsrE/DsrF family protein